MACTNVKVRTNGLFFEKKRGKCSMRTIKIRNCVVTKCPRKCGRELFCVEVEYCDRKHEKYVSECLTSDGTLRVGNRCLMRTIQIVDNEVDVAERSKCQQPYQ